MTEGGRRPAGHMRRRSDQIGGMACGALRGSVLWLDGEADDLRVTCGGALMWSAEWLSEPCGAMRWIGGEADDLRVVG